MTTSFQVKQRLAAFRNLFSKFREQVTAGCNFSGTKFFTGVNMKTHANKVLLFAVQLII